jgi:adenosylmethionine-8-amino-7-oxononanoate aminotransferase
MIIFPCCCLQNIMLAFPLSQPTKNKRFTNMHPRESHLWHPCTQMKDHEYAPPLQVVSASGCYLQLADGRQLFDGISSWWCKSLGHGHPRLREVLLKQMHQFEHVILAGTTNSTIEALSEKLAQLMPTLSKVFYASDGSCAVEIAMKMSVHARQISDELQRHQFMALTNGYHGETVGTLSVSDLGVYRDAYQSMMFAANFISPPYVNNTDDPLWHDCSLHWQQILPQLQAQEDTLTAIIIEPIVQGAGGMKIYSQNFLQRLREWTKARGIHLIADEIMTGLGRTGKMLACEHANITPDFLCLSKGLTSGWLPLSATLTTQSIYDLFYDDYAAGKSFLHSHTYSGNALAASVALETLNIMQEEMIVEKANHIGEIMRAELQKIANATGLLTNMRGIGAICAADIIATPKNNRTSIAVFQEAANHGLLLRPIGNTLYWLPPLIANENDLRQLSAMTENSLRKIF